MRQVVIGVGPTNQTLTQSRDEAARVIMRAAQTPPHWPIEDKAAAVLNVLQELLDAIPNPRWKTAASAALRVPAQDYRGPDCNAVAARWRVAARREGVAESELDRTVERYRSYWTTAAAHLADSFEQRIRELNRSGGWSTYENTDRPQSRPVLPISFDRTDVLYRFDGQRGLQSISYRWITAHGDVDHYETVGWYYNDPEAPVEIVPLANCEVDGVLRALPMGGRACSLKFGRRLKAGDQYFFAYMTVFNSPQRCRPTILYEVRGLSMRALTVRAQFDRNAPVPRKCWHFDVGIQPEGAAIPDDGAPEILEVAPNGYVDHEFTSCLRGRKYGLQWLWDEGA